MVGVGNKAPRTVAGTRLIEETLICSALERDVVVSVLLPPGFDAADVTHYPVLYLNDGQDLTRLKLQAVLDELFDRGEIRPFVLIAPHANHDRLQEYGVAAQADYNDRGSRAGAYTEFVLKELVPFAQANYKASTNPAEAVFAGFSLGGLSAFDLVWHHPEVFARAGVFSGSFWWRSRAIGAGYTPADRIMHAQVRAGQLHPSHQFWLQTGTLDERNDRNENGVIDSLEDTLDLIEELIKLNMNPAQTLRYVQIEGGRHHPDTWGRAMPDFLRWAFGTASSVAALPAPMPVVRLQLPPALTPAIVPADAPPVTGEAPLILLPTAPTAPVKPPFSALPGAEPMGATAQVSHAAALTFHPLISTISFPAATEYLPYYAGYINLVPADTNPLLALREQPQQLHDAFAHLTHEQAHAVYAPGKWTTKQILLHIVDCERIFAYRALRFARGDAQSLTGFDENEYAETGAANARSMSSLLHEYDTNRAATLALLESFTDEQLDRKGTANNAEMSVRALVFILAGHELHHLHVFRERYLPVLSAL